MRSFWYEDILLYGEFVVRRFWYEGFWYEEVLVRGYFDMRRFWYSFEASQSE